MRHYVFYVLEIKKGDVIWELPQTTSFNAGVTESTITNILEKYAKSYFFCLNSEDSEVTVKKWQKINSADYKTLNKFL